MGNSTVALQKIVDFARGVGDLAPMIPAGGFQVQPALDIANRVMRDMLAEKLPWKFNRIICPKFYTISFQQDYPQLFLSNLGWIEHTDLIDINNSQVPQPYSWPRAVKDLRRTSRIYGKPTQICWLPNDQLEQIFQVTWPGAAKKITNPLGAVPTPANPYTMFVDVNGNLLIVTTYGITGGSAPSLPAASAEGTTVADGSVVWSCVNPKGQGFRIDPVPTQTSVVYQVNVIAQAKPTRFTTLQQVIDPIPDDHEPYFRDGFVAYCYERSPQPTVRALADKKKEMWMTTIRKATGADDREPDSYSIVPVRSAMDQGFTGDLGAGWPYGPSF